MNKDNYKYQTLIGLGLFTLGMLTGYASKKYLVENVPLEADSILTNVKKAFNKSGNIEGAWIELTAIPYQLADYQTKIFKGGISRIEANELVQYTFIADAYSGSLINVKRLPTK